MFSRHFGIVVKLDPNGVEVRFDDMTQRIYAFFGDADIQLLHPSAENPNIVYADTPNGRVLAYERNPNNVEVGDVVFSSFQNGSEDQGWKHRELFRGRVAQVYFDKTCDIAYDDGDVSKREMGIH